MSDGIDCTCAARDSSECACDADWTPSEVIELRAEVTRLKAEVSELEASPMSEEALDILRSENAVLKADIRDIFPVAHRLALELECLLLSCNDTAAVSAWWDSAHEALEQWRNYVSR